MDVDDLLTESRLPPGKLAGIARRLHRAIERRFSDADARAGVARDSRSLLDWGRHYLPHYFQRQPSAMHRWLTGELDGLCHQRGKHINVLGPRGAAKSTLVTLSYVLRMAVEGREPYIWIVSDTHRQACSHLDHLKTELLENARLAADYPAAVGAGDVWRAGAIRLNNNVAIEAFGTGQGIRGKRYRAHRPTLIVCDDLQNDGHIASARLREQTRSWFHGTLMKAGTRRTNVVNLATALHRDALAMELAKTPGWTSRAFPSIAQWPGNMLLWDEWEAIFSDAERHDGEQAALSFYQEHRAAMDRGAVVLWPDEEDLYTLMCLRAEGGRTAFEREKQCSPVNPDLCEWPQAYFDDGIWFERWPDNLAIKTMALDPSKGTSDRRGDYSAFVMLGVDANQVVYVEADLARRPTEQMIDDGVALYQRFQPDAFGVEANQFQDLLGGQFLDAFRRQRVLGAAPWTIDNRVNKQVRIRRLGPYLASRRLRFLENSPSTRLLVNQLRDFPIGDHDDGPDALEMALRLAVEISGQEPSGDNLGDRLNVG